MPLNVDESKLYNAETDKPPDEIKKRIVDASPVSMEPAELLRALKTVVEVYYDEAEMVDAKLGMDRAPRLRDALREYLSAFS